MRNEHPPILSASLFIVAACDWFSSNYNTAFSQLYCLSCLPESAADDHDRGRCPDRDPERRRGGRRTGNNARRVLNAARVKQQDERAHRRAITRLAAPKSRWEWAARKMCLPGPPRAFHAATRVHINGTNNVRPACHSRFRRAAQVACRRASRTRAQLQGAPPFHRHRCQGCPCAAPSAGASAVAMTISDVPQR